jgi:probable phosphoglycerate mutase
VDARTVLYLVRHGEAVSNRDNRFGGWSPAPLTDLGHQQAVAAANEMRRRAPTKLVTSDLTRARQTAQPMADLLGLEPRLEPGLRERSLGVFDGLSFAEAEAQYPDMWKQLQSRDPNAVPQGGETADTVFTRVANAIERILTDHPGERVAVVTHGLALFHAFSYICRLGPPSHEHPVFVLVDNASITQLEHRGAHWRIVSINDTAHLRDMTIG